MFTCNYVHKYKLPNIVYDEYFFIVTVSLIAASSNNIYTCRCLPFNELLTNKCLLSSFADEEICSHDVANKQTPRLVDVMFD